MLHVDTIGATADTDDCPTSTQLWPTELPLLVLPFVFMGNVYRNLYAVHWPWQAAGFA